MNEVQYWRAQFAVSVMLLAIAVWAFAPPLVNWHFCFDEDRRPERRLVACDHFIERELQRRAYSPNERYLSRFTMERAIVRTEVGMWEPAIEDFRAALRFAGVSEDFVYDIENLDFSSLNHTGWYLIRRGEQLPVDSAAYFVWTGVLLTDFAPD
ncbi:hypothetical protein HKCCE2091_01780 [Rhodobacterales bacterium HKCCE2091]|nr:hypothetical protein [Rhodobacterales bacterium HKCCE2091]